MNDQILNTCLAALDSAQNNLSLLVNYSHIIPIILSLSLAFFIFFKAKFNLFSKVFLAFVVSFCIWLIGDIFAWTATNYNLVYSSWSPLVYTEIVFFILGLYFVLVFIYEKDLNIFFKLLFLLALVFPFIVTVSGGSVLGFEHSICEAYNNELLDVYKLIIESIVGFVIVGYMIRAFIIDQPREDKKADLIVLGSIFLFLSVFGVSEYIASVTGIYEYNLYALFILPLFLIAIIYAVFELDIFHFNMLGTHYLVGGLVILMGGQLFFINGGADTLLTLVTVALTVGLSIILYRNLKRESDQRVRIEQLSVQLEESNAKLLGLDKLKTEFLSLASHQLRSPLTSIKGYASMVVEGDFGEIGPKAKEAVDRIFQSSQNLTIVVEDLLNVSKIESGGMKYEMLDFNMTDIVKSTAEDLAITAGKKGLKLNYSEDGGNHKVKGDKEKLRQVVLNLIDNSIKYTKEGSIEVRLSNKDKKVLVEIKDTGMGVSPEIKATLFQKFARGEGQKMNTGGSGLGLYLAKEIVDAHKGKVWVESPGMGLGSTFFIELDAVA
jgi:signal transduction histidine kinase